jgi:hypothetical protein
MPIVAQDFDSNLGRWTHAAWRPGPGDPLEWAVDRVWDFDGMAAHSQERVFPNRVTPSRASPSVPATSTSRT